MTRRVAVVALVALALGGCASMRKVDVGGSATTYRLNVYNARGGTVAVSYMDGNTERSLGNVAAGATESFIVASPASSTISVRARTSGGTMLGPYTVVLTPDAATRVTIQ